MSHRAPQRQHTVYLKTRVEGVALHTGRRVRLSVGPAPVDAGIVFVRTDTGRDVEIPARTDHVVDTTLSTTLGRDGVKVGTVEHLLAALYGMGIDNARVELDGPEVPVLDGSAAPFVELLERAGIREQKAPRRVAVVRRSAVISDGDKEVRVAPGSGLSVHCSIDFAHPLITDQHLSLDVTPRSFAREIASARTFGFLRDVDRMQSCGFALGGSLANAIVIDEFSVLNPGGLRWPDEFVRHKMLDAMGDLALLGLPLAGQFHAHKTGHRLNHRLVQRLLSEPGLVEVVAAGEAVVPRPSANADIAAGLFEGAAA